MRSRLITSFGISIISSSREGEFHSENYFFTPPKPYPPTGSVTVRSPKLAMSGFPRPIACFTEGRESEALWLAWLSHTSVIQIAFASAGSLATT